MLSAENLSFSYGGGPAMAFPRIALPQGGVLLLQGASGSGKSTLLALCCGLLPLQAGRLEVAGQDMAALQGAARDAWRGRNVGFLPQRLHLSESLTVRGNLGLAFFAAGLPEDAKLIDGALQALGVAQLADSRPSELSGGQAQRVALARAVLLSPKIMLADEPTASLDDEAANQACALLVQTAQRCSASLVVATHDARVGSALAAMGQTAQRVQLGNLSKIGSLAISGVREAL
jgi:putative ABC transport system ATP-binding protein